MPGFSPGSKKETENIKKMVTQSRQGRNERRGGHQEKSPRPWGERVRVRGTIWSNRHLSSYTKKSINETQERKKGRFYFIDKDYQT